RLLRGIRRAVPSAGALRVHVDSLTPNKSGRGYFVETSIGRFEAENIVVATGLYQRPKTSAFSADFPPEVKQIHSDEYRNPESLPAGSVLVVGSGQSGAQIAEELYQSGRKIYLSVSQAGRVPRRYRARMPIGGTTGWVTMSAR